MSRFSRVSSFGAKVESGRTLIELLIAMVLSLLIIGAVGALYSFSSNTSRQSFQSSSVEESGKLALHLIGEPITMAGYGTLRRGDLGGAAATDMIATFGGPHLRGCTNGRFANPQAGDFTCVATPLPGDALHIGYQAENVISAAQGTEPMRDCLGQDPITATFDGENVPVVYNDYAIQLSANQQVPELACLGGASNTPAALVRNVEDFKVFFAFDNRSYNWATGAEVATSSVPSTLATATEINQMLGNVNGQGFINPWNFVVGVYVCVLVRSAETGVTPDGQSVYSPCPQTAAEVASGTAQVTLNDGVSRRSYSKMYTIRSRTQSAPGINLQ